MHGQVSEIVGIRIAGFDLAAALGRAPGLDRQKGLCRCVFHSLLSPAARRGVPRLRELRARIEAKLAEMK